MTVPSALRVVPARRSGGTSRSDRCLIEVGPWQVRLFSGFDYIYDYPDRWACGHVDFLSGELDEPILARFGEEGLAWARDEVAATPARHADTYDADRRTADCWRRLPELAKPAGLASLPAPSWDAPVEGGGATWRGLVDGHPRVEFADGSHRVLHGNTRAVGVAEDALWALHDELVVALAGAAPSWLDMLETYGLGRWNPVRLIGLDVGSGVWGRVAHDMPPQSDLGGVLGKQSWLRLDAQTGPSGRAHA